MEKITCSFNFWEWVGIPFRYVIATMSYESRNPEDYVHASYLRKTYKRCYIHNLSPVNGKDVCLLVNTKEMLPLEYKVLEDQRNREFESLLN
jgi:hypothetical protein